MSAIAGTVADSIIERVARRWTAIDPLLPGPQVPWPGCGAELVLAEPGSQPAALGACEHWAWIPESFHLSWGTARRFQLTAHVAGRDIAASLGRLLSLWSDHLADVPGADARDTVAVITWPSHDIVGAATLLKHGFVPLAVIAARETRHDRDGRPVREGLRIRRAAAGDIDTVVRLGMDVLQFDAHFSVSVAARQPVIAAALRREAAGLLAGPEPWTWLAENEGTPIGMLSAQRPEAAGWTAQLARPAPASYTMLLDVLPGNRGRGVGAALVARLHSEAEAAGVAATLLRYEQLNPLAVPFWSRQGYRPLWTVWEIRPASAIRSCRMSI